MRKFILISHAYLAKGVVSALDMIIGERENVNYYVAYKEDGDDFKEKIIKEIESYEAGTEIIILTDIFGGSVNNQLLDLIKIDNVHLISGMNLILAMELLLSNEDTEIESLINSSINNAKEGIIYCNQLENHENEELDDF